MAPRRFVRRWQPASLDELTLDVAPVLLGAGERLFDGVTDPGLTPIEVTSSPFATHLHYRVGPTASD